MMYYNSFYIVQVDKKLYIL